MIWKLIAYIVSSPTVASWLINRAQRTPYQHIQSADNTERYMGRWWLFNPYPHGSDGDGRLYPWLPSVRIHHICRADRDRHLHDHPWNARTIILRGWYTEERPWHRLSDEEAATADGILCTDEFRRGLFHRVSGYTGRLLFGQYHRISSVSEAGVWTLFIVGKKRGTWGFEVNGAKVPWRQYLGLDEEGGAA